jgi:hypothetical protein
MNFANLLDAVRKMVSVSVGRQESLIELHSNNEASRSGEHGIDTKDFGMIWIASGILEKERGRGKYGV